MRNCSYDKTLVMSQEEPEAIFLKCTWSKIVKKFHIFPEQFCSVATKTCFGYGLGCFGSNNVEFLLRQFRECFSLFWKPCCWIAAHTNFWRRFRKFFAAIRFKCSQNKFWEVSCFVSETKMLFCSRDIFWKGLFFRSNNVEVQQRSLIAKVWENFRDKTVEKPPRQFLKMAQAFGKY